MRAHLENAGSGGSLRMRPTGAGAAQLRRHVERLDLAVRQAEAAEAAAAELLEDRRRLLEPRIARHELLAAPFDEAAVERRREALEAARREAGRWSDERGIVGRARLVATTLTGFRLHRDVAAGRYDTVVADDVGGSPLAEIILPVQVIDAGNCAAWNVPFEARPSPDWNAC